MLEIGSTTQTYCQGISRRSFLQVGFISALGLTLPDFLRLKAEGAVKNDKQRAIILVWLWGGPSQLDTWDMKPDAPIEYRGPFSPIKTNVPGIEICELFPRLARQADKYAIIRSLHHNENDHGIAGCIGLTGKPPIGSRAAPHLGAIVSRVKETATSLIPFMVIGSRLQQGHRYILGEGGGTLGGAYDPFRVELDPDKGVLVRDLVLPQTVSTERYKKRVALLRQFDPLIGRFQSSAEAAAVDKFYEEAFSLTTGGKATQVLNLDKEPAKVRDRYGRTRFGQSCLLARRLVEAGVPFVQVNWSAHVEAEEDAGDGGWDHHYRNFEIMQERYGWVLDDALSALLEDLHQRGLLESTVVLAVGEFGRTPKINASAGRDHWPACYSALIAGGGIKGGQVIGASDKHAAEPVERPVTPADLAATVLERVGIGTTELTAIGLTPGGEVIRELI
ncbi:MAG: DUF1501 domain-containing protein [Abditibacteriales bacterium]|nr:DUF1501 domain-containing protein [Abditibacteriales bacterium]MDW8364542.1 DUF1501 domain-containing protein [Abditibacteriales bacterium]